MGPPEKPTERDPESQGNIGQRVDGEDDAGGERASESRERACETIPVSVRMDYVGLDFADHPSAPPDKRRWVRWALMHASALGSVASQDGHFGAMADQFMLEPGDEGGQTANDGSIVRGHEDDLRPPRVARSHGLTPRSLEKVNRYVARFVCDISIRRDTHGKRRGVRLPVRLEAPCEPPILEVVLDVVTTQLRDDIRVVRGPA